MWRMIGIPNVMAVQVGGKVETVVLRTAFTIISLLAVGGLFYPAVLRRFDIEL
jgi:hypothetical protein